MDLLKIISTNIQYYEYNKVTYHYLEAIDQYGRYWTHKDSRYEYRLNFNEVVNIENIEIQKGVIDKEKYWINEEKVPRKTNKLEKILYVYTYDLNYQEPNAERDDDPEYEATIHIITEDDLVYEHDLTFKNYQKLKDFALKIKEKGIVNLKYWHYLWGGYDYENNYHEEFEENKESNYYYDDDSKTDLYYNVGGNGEDPVYLSNDMWALPDGSIIQK